MSCRKLIENPDETDDLLRLGLYRLPIREFPLLRSLAPALASYDGATELERGLDILLTGLTDSLTPRPAGAASPRPARPMISPAAASPLPVIVPSGPASPPAASR